MNMHQTIYPESICPKSNNNSDKSITKINNNNNGSNKQYAYHINPIIAEMNPNPFQTKKNINSKKKLGVGASFAVDSRRRHDSRHWSLHRRRRRRRSDWFRRQGSRRRRRLVRTQTNPPLKIWVCRTGSGGRGLRRRGLRRSGVGVGSSAERVNGGRRGVFGGEDER